MNDENDNFDDYVYERNEFLEYKEQICWLSEIPKAREIDFEKSLKLLNKGLVTLRDDIKSLRVAVFELYDAVRPRERGVDVLVDLLDKVSLKRDITSTDDTTTSKEEVAV
jgi:hypothetical protein